MADYINRSEIKYEQWNVGPLCAPMMVVRKKTIEYQKYLGMQRKPLPDLPEEV